MFILKDVQHAEIITAHPTEMNSSAARQLNGPDYKRTRTVKLRAIAGNILGGDSRE
jgi:hypothetical protein